MPEPSTKRHALSQIFRRLRPSIPRTLFTAGVLLVAGVLEGATVGLLVPLLAVLTSSGAEAAPLAVLGSWIPWLPPEQRVMALVLAIGAVAITKNGFQVLGNYSSSVLRSDMVLELRRQLLERVLHAGPAALEQHTSGEITDVFVAEAYRVNRFIELCLMLVQRAIIGLAYIAAMLALSWRLTAATMLLGVCVAAVTSRLGRNVLGHGRELSKTSSQLGRQVTEIVGGLRVIRTTASEPAFEENFAQISRASARADIGSSLSLSVQLAGIEAVGVAGALGLVTLARELWLTSGMLDVPHFLAFGFGLVRLLPALNIVYATYGHVTVTMGTVENTLRWLDLARHPARPFGDEPVPRLDRGIEFRDVSFAYPNGHQPLSGLSFVLPAGQTLAVLGPSGAGKSTLANLLLRLREPSGGVIQFDDTDHWQFSSPDFHRAVGFVDQDSFLFNTSIADNVTCGRPGIERAQIEKALRLVQLGDLIDRLPEGIDTVLAERGATLSGGQRQRIAIARAVVTDPQVLVLDEPTSALDLETEEEVMQAVSAASLGRTTLIITHRAAILRHATLRLDLGTGKVTAVLSEAGGAPTASPADSGVSA